MISITTLAQAAYEAYAQTNAKRLGKQAAIYPWECLKGHEQAAWIASVQAVRNQLATVQ